MRFVLFLFLALPRLIQPSPRSCLSIKSGVVFVDILFLQVKTINSFPNAANPMATGIGKHVLIKTDATSRLKGELQLLKCTLQHY